MEDVSWSSLFPATNARVSTIGWNRFGCRLLRSHFFLEKSSPLTGSLRDRLFIDKSLGYCYYWLSLFFWIHSCVRSSRALYIRTFQNWRNLHGKWEKKRPRPWFLIVLLPWFHRAQGDSLFQTPFRPETSTTFGESWPADLGRKIIVSFLLPGLGGVDHPYICAVKRVFPRSQIGVCSLSNCICTTHDSQSNCQLGYFSECKERGQNYFQWFDSSKVLAPH